ncbi:efflux RND transporter periplasmic adaptor subunit [Phaeodactylibacter xiamenensis]|uniref:efflux RND transporter periplasmic adaptor subunit n=1 Tax=Phaeodactylibacter xiamenensis TaxID=1524460 RepID=UPI003BAC1A47
MDRPISDTKKKRRLGKNALRITGLIAVLVGALFVLRSMLTKELDRKDFQTATVEVGKVEEAITASGLVVPAFEQQLTAPVTAAIQEVRRQSGDQVERGDTILQLDEEYIRLQYESLADQLELKKNKITRLRHEYDKNIQDLAYESEIKALQISSLEAQLADTKRLREIGSATPEEVDQAQLQLDIARLEKQKLDNELRFREQVLPGDRRNLELEVRMEEKKSSELSRKLRETSVIAPRSGVITWINEDLGKQVSEGELLVRLADLQRYRIEATCSDRYAAQVKIGLPVRVRINQTDLNGRISTILPAVENNTVAFIVELDEPDHPKLRPNRRVEVFLIANAREQALRLKNGPAFRGKTIQPLFVVDGKEARRTEARIGLTSVDYVELLETDLQPGQQVIISDMAAYEHLEQIKLEE